MYLRTRQRENSALQRRLFLKSILGLGAAVPVGPLKLFAGDTPNQPLREISPADSLFLYLNLLDRVSNAAYHFMADAVASDYQECSTLLDRFGEKLSELRRELCGTSVGGVEGRTEQQMDAASNNIQSLRVSVSSSSRQTIAALPAASTIADEMARCVGKLLPDGDIKLSAKARDILKDMLALVEQQRSIATKANTRQFKLNRDWREMYFVFESMRGDLLSAARDILKVSDSGTEAEGTDSLLLQANDKIKRTVKQLGAIAVHQEGSSVKADLVALLGAVEHMLAPDRPVSLKPIIFRSSDTSQPISRSSRITPLPWGDLPDERLKDRVLAIVRENFQPGGNIQVFGCMAVCMPIWITFSQKKVRVNLIREALLAIYHEIRNIETVAEKLAIAYPNYS
jgi:hypothetical protein